MDDFDLSHADSLEKMPEGYPLNLWLKDSRRGRGGMGSGVGALCRPWWKAYSNRGPLRYLNSIDPCGALLPQLSPSLQSSQPLICHT